MCSVSEQSIDDSYEEVHSALLGLLGDPSPTPEAVMALVTDLAAIYNAAQAANDMPYIAACLSDRAELVEFCSRHNLGCDFTEVFPAISDQTANPIALIQDWSGNEAEGIEPFGLFSSVETVSDLTSSDDSDDLFTHIAGVHDDTEFGAFASDTHPTEPFIAPRSSAVRQNDPTIEDSNSQPSANIWDPRMPTALLNQHLEVTRGWVSKILGQRYHLDLLPSCYQQHDLVMDSLFILYREWVTATNAMTANRSDLMRVWWSTLESWIRSASEGGVIYKDLSRCLHAEDHQEYLRQTLVISTDADSSVAL